MPKKKTPKPKTAETVKKGVKEREESLEQLSKLSKEELLIKLGQLMSENAALRQKAMHAAETTKVFRRAADKYLRQPLQDTMKDWED